MARFSAYDDSSSSGASDEEGTQSQQTSPLRPENGFQRRHGKDIERHEDSESDDESSESSSTSDMQEDELVSSPRHTQLQKKDRNALVRDRDGEVRYAHEIQVHVSPPSSSGSPPARNGSAGTPIIPFAYHVGVDAQKMHVMQASLFRMPEEAAALKALNQPQKQPAAARINLRAPLQSLNRKHSRDSDGDGPRFESRERASFAHDVEPPVYRPSRKYARVEISSSIVNGNEGAYIDAGLAMGRSFRVGWGPGGTLVHLGSLCGPFSIPKSSANSSIVTVTKSVVPQTLSIAPPSVNALPSSSAPELASKLLQHHLSHTPITLDESGIVFAYPSSSSSRSSTPLPNDSTDAANPDVQVELNFNSFASLFPTTDTSGPAALFRLGSALFDPIDLYLASDKRKRSGGPSAITPDIRNRILLLRRKASLTKWLEDVVKPSVEGDLRVKANGNAPNSTYTPADAIFTHLTGHQVEQACNVAFEDGYPRLATLVSQAGGDAIFKEDLRSQLAIWKAEKLGPSPGTNGQGLIGRGVWRVYSLLAGLLGGDNEDTNIGEDVCAGLDWKRVFGLCLWYGESVDASIADVVRAYEALLLLNSRGVAKPVPTWLSDVRRIKGPSTALALLGSSQLGMHIPNAEEREPRDALYALVKLHADPVLSLSHVLDPLSFAPSGIDWGVGMCWHLYIILSRVMRIRDFADRGDPGVRRHNGKANGLANGVSGSEKSSDDEQDDDDGVEGHSPTADLLASSYAFELESWGMVQEAVFVLMHIEGSVGREKAIKDLLARSAPRLDEWMTRGLVGSLKLPGAWVDQAKAMYAYQQGEIFKAYELYLSGGLYSLAHDIAVFDLAPDAVIRRDLELLKSLFDKLAVEGRKEKVHQWASRGQVYLDYVHIMTRLPQLQDQFDAENEEGRPAVPDAAQAHEIDELSRRIPNLITSLPEVLYRTRANDPRHPAAFEEMVKGLLALAERTKPMVLTQIQPETRSTLDSATKLELVRGTGYARFLQSIGA